MKKIETIRFCIVGTGFSGTCALVHLVNRLISARPSSSIEIVTVEERNINGPGYPFDPDSLLPSHLCNTQARLTSLHDNDFFDWLIENSHRIITTWPNYIKEVYPTVDIRNWQPSTEDFYPRALYGIYLSERFNQTVEKAHSHGLKVTILNGVRVIDGHRKGEMFNIILEDAVNGDRSVIEQVDKVLLSTGHWNPNIPSSQSPSSETYLDSPYPYKQLEECILTWCDKKASHPLKVFVKGMGPSGIDAILSVAESGEFHYSEDGHISHYSVPQHQREINILAGSRSGLFPAVRGNVIDYNFKYLTADSYYELASMHGGKLTIDDILSIIDAELSHATGGRIGWKDITAPQFSNACEKLKYDITHPELNSLIYAVIMKARRMKFYRHLEGNEKQRYDRELDSHFIRIVAPMPARNGEKLLALFDAGFLKCVKLGGESDITPRCHGEQYQIYDVSTNEVHTVDVLIRATGQDFKLSRHPAPLISSLLEKGEVLANIEEGYDTGGLMLDNLDSYTAMCRDVETTQVIRSPFISSFGVIARYWQNERNYSSAFVKAAMWLSEEWVEYCFARSHKSPKA
ncbi:FAD/NAD(P)-binding protein [Aeromonas dhakensis]|uniref:FAD/NAD(P)-binding protein n=1 Tax=Aeromonas dhakensis TaxID=196024 RepID=UPI0034470A8C